MAKTTCGLMHLQSMALFRGGVVWDWLTELYRQVGLSITIRDRKPVATSDMVTSWVAGLERRVKRNLNRVSTEHKKKQGSLLLVSISLFVLAAWTKMREVQKMIQRKNKQLGDYGDELADGPIAVLSDQPDEEEKHRYICCGRCGQMGEHNQGTCPYEARQRPKKPRKKRVRGGTTSGQTKKAKTVVSDSTPCSDT